MVLLVLLAQTVDFGLGAHEVHEAAFGSADDLLRSRLVQRPQSLPLQRQVALDVLTQLWLEVAHQRTLALVGGVGGTVQGDRLSITWLHLEYWRL